MSVKFKKLLQAASQFEKLALKKKASPELATFISRNYDTIAYLLEDFVESLKAANHKGYENGKGFPEEIFNKMQEQASLVEKALNSIMPEIKRIDDEIYGELE